MPAVVRDTRTVEQAMSGQFAFCFPSTGLAQAARMMAQNRVIELPVIVDQRCLGYVSYLDILQRYVRAQLDVRTADLVRTPLPVVRPDALLVEKDGGIVGLFGHREAIAAFADGSGPVGTYMRRPLPGRNVADSLESGADIMYREDTPVVLMTQDEGPLFRKTSRTVGIVSAHAVLTEIGKTTTDTASNKVFSGRRDLSLNVPVSPCQRACPIHQDIAAYVDYVSQGRYLDSWLVIHETNPFPSML